MKKIILCFLTIFSLLIIFPLLRINETEAAKESIFGVTYNASVEDHQKVIEMMSQAGIKWKREFFRWAIIEPEKEQWNFGQIDRRLDLLASAGIQSYAVISRTPEWAEIPHQPLTEEKCTLWGANYAPKSAEWRHFLKKIVSRYGCGKGGRCQIRYWEIYWEENGDCYLLGSDNRPSPEDYLRILKIASEEIKTIDPSAKIIFGRLLPAGVFNYIEYLTEVKKRGGDAYFDAVSFGGPYGAAWKGCPPGGELRERIQKIRNVVPNKEIWATEVVCSSNYHFDGENEKCEIDPKGEKIQAETLKEYYRIAKEEGIQKLFWQSFQDRINYPLAGKRCLGLIRDDFTPKPSYCAYKEIATGVPCILLSSGWNKITWPNIQNYTAKIALEDIDNDCGAGTAVAIAKKEKDWWESFIKNFGGKDFGLSSGKSYHINVVRDCNWIP